MQPEVEDPSRVIRLSYLLPREIEHGIWRIGAIDGFGCELGVIRLANLYSAIESGAEQRSIGQPEINM